jgi:hypothetical protein
LIEAMIAGRKNAWGTPRLPVMPVVCVFAAAGLPRRDA